jgi:DVNP family
MSINAKEQGLVDQAVAAAENFLGSITGSKKAEKPAKQSRKQEGSSADAEKKSPAVSRKRKSADESNKKSGGDKKKSKKVENKKKKIAHSGPKHKYITIMVPRVEDDSSTDESEGESAKKVKEPKKIGTKREVFSGRALKTPGGLTKEDIVKSKSGRIVSKRASDAAKLNWAKRNLQKPKFVDDGKDKEKEEEEKSDSTVSEEALEEETPVVVDA